MDFRCLRLSLVASLCLVRTTSSTAAATQGTYETTFSPGLSRREVSKIIDGLSPPSNAHLRTTQASPTFPLPRVSAKFAEKFRRQSDVTNNFHLMQNLVSGTWIFTMCALPRAIMQPSLMPRALGVACRLFAGATTGVVFLGCGQQVVQNTVVAAVGLPECWRGAAVPLAAAAARISTDLMAGALLRGPFALSAPAAMTAVNNSPLRAVPGGTLLNLAFLYTMHQNIFSMQDPHNSSIIGSAHYASRDASGGHDSGIVDGADVPDISVTKTCHHVAALVEPEGDAYSVTHVGGVALPAVSHTNRFVRRFGPSNLGYATN